MKDFKTFVKIAFWMATTIVVFGGIMSAGLWWSVPSNVVFVGMVILFVVLFGSLLIGMLILDVMIDAKERKVTYTRVSNRDTRCKGYVEIKPKEKNNVLHR